MNVDIQCAGVQLLLFYFASVIPKKVSADLVIAHQVYLFIIDQLLIPNLFKLKKVAHFALYYSN